ncbi:unnamed protein product, partial [Cladocopium goreaui]
DDAEEDSDGVHDSRPGSASSRQRVAVANEEMSPLEVHFSQMRANPHFRDGRSLDKAIEEIEKVPWSGSSPKDADKPVWLLKAPFPPIEVMKWRCKLRDEATGRPLVDPQTGGELLDAEDRWFTLDNRRLYCLQKVAVSLWPDRAVAEVCCLPSTKVTKMRQLKKFRTLDRGCTILVGNRVGGPMLGRWSWRETAGIQEPTPAESKVQINRRRPRRDYAQEQASALAKQHRRERRDRSQAQSEEENWLISWRGILAFVLVYVLVRCVVRILAVFRANFLQ